MKPDERARQPDSQSERRVGEDWLVGGGEMAKVIKEKDWSKTALGPIASWPQSLRTVVSLVQASKSPIALIWGPGHTQLYNDGYWPVCGAKHPVSMGQDFRECWAEAWPVIGEAYETAWTGRSSHLENMRIFLDRYGFLEETWFTFSFSPITDESGRLGGLFHPVLEVTNQMLAERRTRTLRDLASRSSRAKNTEEAFALCAQTLAESDLDIPFSLFYLMDAEAETTRLVAQSGLPPGTPSSPRQIDLETESEPPWLIREVVHSGAVQQIDDATDRLGGRVVGPYPERPKMAFAFPILQPGSERPAGVLVAGVSARSRMNEQYRAFYDLVATAVSTALTNARAYEEERRRAEALAEIDRAKTTFFSNVSHEFRTPLTLMLGPTEDLLAGAQGELTAPQRAQLELLRRNELRLQRLVNALLEFSRIEAGRVQASYEPLDLASLTRDLASSFRSAVERAGLEFTVDCPPLDEPVFVDREMWERIVLNLLSNAFKFTFEGRIEVSLRSSDDSAVLRVSDTGVGVRPEEVPRLFERFHRVEGTRARTHEGSGIGLALVQELVRLHGGSIRAESKYGSGTSFTVTIPTGSAHLPQDRIGAKRTLESTSMGAAVYVEEALRWLPSAEAPLEPANTPSKQQKEQGTGGASIESARVTTDHARILVADDNADMRSYLRRILEAEWSVETVTDGEAALAAARARRPDVILTDIMMPILDGFGLLRKLRADPDTAGIPVVMLSARVGEEARVEGLAAGAEDYLIKPFSARELVARIRTHLELARLRDEIRERQSDLFAVLMQAPIGMCVVRGPELVYEMANQPYLEIIKRGPDVVGKRLLEVFPELAEQTLAGQGFDDTLRGVMTTATAFEAKEVPTTIVRDGVMGPAYFTTIFAPIRSPDGRIDRVIVVVSEVTDQVLARHKAEEARQHIAKSEADLRQAVALRDEFLTVASHELRTPLTTLGFQADGLLRGLQQARASDGETKRWLERAEKVRVQADRLEQLIEGMLDVFSLDRQKLQLNPERMDLAEVARVVVERLRTKSKQAHASISLRAEPSVGHWDRRRLEQILAQLVSNALKFGAGQPVDVFIGGSATFARILVKDRGIGIAGDDQERIFERFVRVAPSNQYGGFGLGLWIVRELVQAMGGSIQVESQQPGAGATFIVELPRHP